MITCYPKSSFYTKHYDNAIGNGRKLTTILYLNDGWSSEDGGELKLYLNPRSGEDVGSKPPHSLIEPKLGRLLLFWSDRRCPHEVRRHTENVILVMNNSQS
jgi:hypoxia-inducible factor (prolyl hydroxylase)